jgi:adenylate cyclase class 2
VHEVEVKYQISDPEAAGKAHADRGIRLGEPAVQDDQAFAPGGWGCGDPTDDVAFARLRTVNDRHTFTVKRPAENQLACMEHETAVANRDEMHLALTTMGWYPTVRIVKTRRQATAGDLTICLDQVEHVGAFLEIERILTPGQDAQTIQDELAVFVVQLGIDAQRTTATYDQLVRASLTTQP